MSEIRLEGDKTNVGIGKRQGGDGVKAEERAGVLDQFFFKEEVWMGAALSIISFVPEVALADSSTPGMRLDETGEIEVWSGCCML